MKFVFTLIRLLLLEFWKSKMSMYIFLSDKIICKIVVYVLVNSTYFKFFVEKSLKKISSDVKFFLNGHWTHLVHYMKFRSYLPYRLISKVYAYLFWIKVNILILQRWVQTPNISNWQQRRRGGTRFLCKVCPIHH